MPVNRFLIAGFALAACATPPPPAEPEGADRLDAAVEGAVRAGRDRGSPNLADVPERGATPADAAALGAEADTLKAEAAALVALRDEANAPRPPSDLPRRAAALRAEIDRTRGELAARPPIERPRAE